MGDDGDLSISRNGETKEMSESKIVVNRRAMNQVQFHETFQLVPKRATLKRVADRLHISKESVRFYFI